MQIKINGEQPFQVLSTNFTIGPSESGYDLYFSADGINGYSKLFTVSANTNRQVTSVAAGSYYILSGNTDEVTVNWIKECGNGGGGGGSYVLPVASESTLGGVKIGSGITIDENGAISAEGGGTQYAAGDGIEISGSTISVKAGEGLSFSGDTLIATSYVLPVASESTLGGIKVGSGITIDENGVLSAYGGGGVPVAESLDDASIEAGMVVSLVGAPRTIFGYDGIDSDPYEITITNYKNDDYTFQMDGQDFAKWYKYYEEDHDFYIYYRWLANYWDDDNSRIVASFEWYVDDPNGRDFTPWNVSGTEIEGRTEYFGDDLYKYNAGYEKWDEVNYLNIIDLNKVLESDTYTIDDLVEDIYGGKYDRWDNIYFQFMDASQGDNSPILYHVRGVAGEIWFSSSDATNSTDGVYLQHYYIPYNPNERYVHLYSRDRIYVPEFPMRYYAGITSAGTLAGCDLESLFNSPDQLYTACIFTYQDPSNPDGEKVSVGTVKWWNKYETEVDSELRWYTTFAVDVPVNNVIWSGVWGFLDNSHIETLSWTSGATYESQTYPPYNP